MPTLVWGLCLARKHIWEGDPMGREPANPVVRLPGWVMIVFSLVVVFHFGAVVLCSLATGSGPWVTDDGPDFATPPQFAFSLFRTVGSPYLKLVKLHNTYHFASN